MKKTIEIIVQILYVLSFCGAILSWILGAVCEIIGYAKFEQMLSAIGISNGFQRVWVISLISVFLLIITYFIKNKFFN